MKQCIKIGIRHNLIYLLMLIILNFLRKVDLIVLDKVFKLKISIIFINLMFLGEFLAGLIIYKYQISYLPKKKRNTVNGVELISRNLEIKPRDSRVKIYLLLFLASLFDFIEFLISTVSIPTFEYMSKTLEIRLSSFLTLSSAFFFIYVLKLQIYKHHIFSLLIILACLIIIGISEYFFQYFDDKRTKEDFFQVLLSVLGVHFFNSLLDSVEKYLLEYDFVNPFQTLMFEGGFGIILSIIYLFITRKSSFIEIIDIYYKNENNITKFIFLIICLCLYLILNGGRNAYRVATNKIYSPMAKTLTDYILNPFFIIYYFIFEDDFIGGKQNKQDIFYFVLNLILSIIIVFCGCIYNEFLVLFCYNLEHDTHSQVALRSETKEFIEFGENYEDNSSDEDNEEENETKDNPNDS